MIIDILITAFLVQSVLQQRNTNIGPIVGGALGGCISLFIVVIIVAVIVILVRRRDRIGKLIK